MFQQFLSLGAMALAGLASSAYAQQFTVGPVVTYPSGEAAGTPASAAGHGAADVIRAQGMYNEMTADSLLKFEQARKQYLANQRTWLDLVGARRRAILAQHDRNREEARARNIRYREEKIGRATLPPRLTSVELDGSTGEVAWPRALQRDTFAIERADIEKLLAARAAEGMNIDQTDALYAKTVDLKSDLRDHIREIRTQDYMQARKFLDSLLLESQFPVDQPTIARKSQRNETRTVSLER